MLGGPYLFSKIRSTCCNCCFTISILKILGSDSASTTAIVMSKCIPTASRSATNLSGSANPEVYPKKHKNGWLKKTTHTHQKKKDPRSPTQFQKELTRQMVETFNGGDHFLLLTSLYSIFPKTSLGIAKQKMQNWNQSEIFHKRATIPFDQPILMGQGSVADYIKNDGDDWLIISY